MSRGSTVSGRATISDSDGRVHLNRLSKRRPGGRRVFETEYDAGMQAPTIKERVRTRVDSLVDLDYCRPKTDEPPD